MLRKEEKNIKNALNPNTKKRSKNKKQFRDAVKSKSVLYNNININRKLKKKSKFNINLLNLNININRASQNINIFGKNMNKMDKKKTVKMKIN